MEWKFYTSAGLIKTSATGGGGTSDLDGLSDVAITAVAQGDILRRDATEFTNTNIGTNEIVARIAGDVEGLAVAASRMVGRKSTGDVGEMTAAEVKTLLAIVAADVSDFDTQVQTNTLDSMTGTLAVTKGGTGGTTAASARTNLDVDQAGTDNSTDVTLAGVPNYLTIIGQIITRALIDLTSHITGILPLANGGSGVTTAATGPGVWQQRTNGATITVLKNNYIATTAPGTTDDTGSGYEVGSNWYDVTVDKAYVALDVTTSAAVWTETTQTGGGGGTDYICLADEKTSGTHGGTFTSGAWRTRDVNTEIADAGGHATISTNQITLAAGTYQFSIVAVGRNVDSHQLRLQNVTDAATIEDGLSVEARTTSQQMTIADAKGRFTIAGSKTFEVQHQCGTTANTTGFGIASSFGVEKYMIVEFWKES